MLVYTDEGWIPPWRKDLTHAACVHCSRVVVEITRTRGACRPCTVRLGVKPEDPPPEEQLEIPLF